MTDENANGQPPTRQFTLEIADREMFVATAAYGSNGKRIMRTAPIAEVLYIDARDAGHLLEQERWKYRWAGFWTEVAMAWLTAVLRHWATGAEIEP